MSDADWIETLAYDIQSQCSSWELSMAGDAMATFDVCGAKLLIQRAYAEHCRSVDTDKLAERIAEACYDADGTIISVGIVEEFLAPILARNAAMEAVLMECRAFVADTAHTEFLLSMFSRTAEGMAKHGAIASAWESLLSRIDALTAKGAGQ